MDIRSHVLRRILLSKNYEPRITSLITRHLDPRRDAIDAGANIGLFTLLLASLLNPERKVLAVEPTPGALELLRLNIERHDGAACVEVFEGVVSDYVGEAVVLSVPGKEEYSSIDKIVHPAIEAGEEQISLRVPSTTIDELVERLSIDPGFLKIDAEGAECSILEGARKTLIGYKPVVIMELSSDLLAAAGRDPAEAIAYLSNLGYDVVDASTMRPIEDFPFDGDALALPGRDERG